jgi:hypothetical protein
VSSRTSGGGPLDGGPHRQDREAVRAQCLAASRAGRPGKSAEELALEDARAEIERLRATVTEQAVELHLFRGKGQLGLSAGPVPTRVDAEVKAGLLELIDQAVAGGWSTARACRVLGLHPDRAGRWRRRREAGDGLDDAAPGPDEPLHALLDWERDAIDWLFDTWGEIDRSHRKLAHRGSGLEKVFVSESSVLRVLRAENLVLPARPPRSRSSTSSAASGWPR